MSTPVAPLIIKQSIWIGILFLLVIQHTFSQDLISQGWEYWRLAELERAEMMADASLETDGGKHLKGNLLQVKGKYAEAIEVYETITPDYEAYDQVVNSMLTIQLFHLQALERAKILSQQLDPSANTVYAQSVTTPMQVACSGNFTVPMLQDEPLNPYIPILPGKVNGFDQKLAFDTGGNFLIMTEEMAKRLGITYDTALFFIGKQGFSSSKMWVGMVDELVLGEAVVLNHVPVTILAEMNTEILIFGTNIIKAFLTTVDYPNQQFVFTTLDQPDLLAAHRKRYKGHSMKFIMWGDHYMMGKGRYNDQEVNMFFDSGLVVVGQVEGQIVQSWLCLSKESMDQLGIEEKDQTSAMSITPTSDTLAFANREHTQVMLSLSGQGSFSFGGIACDLLISHGVLHTYAWTLDFERMVYMFK